MRSKETAKQNKLPKISGCVGRARFVCGLCAVKVAASCWDFCTMWEYIFEKLINEWDGQSSTLYLYSLQRYIYYIVLYCIYTNTIYTFKEFFIVLCCALFSILSNWISIKAIYLKHNKHFNRYFDCSTSIFPSLSFSLIPSLFFSFSLFPSFIPALL